MPHTSPALLALRAAQSFEQEPTHQAETRVVDRGTQAKLGLSQPHAIAAKVNVFTFKKTVTAEDSAKIPIVTRVTVDGDGNVLKITGN